MRTSTLALPFLATALAVSAGAGTLVAVDGSRVLYQIDMTTGAKTMIGTVSSNAGTTAGLARNSSNGTIYLTSTGNDSVYTLDLTTGNATLIGAYGDTTLVMHGLEWDGSTGTLYGGSNGNLYTINPTTGVAALVGTSGLTSFTNLGYDSANDAMYATNSGTDSFYSVDRTTGAMTLIGVLGAGSTNPNGLAFNTENNTMYMVDNSADNLYTINLTTGAATLVGSTGTGNLLGLVFIPDVSTTVPFCFGDGSGTACPCGNAGITGNGCASSVNAAGANLTTSGSASIGGDTLALLGSGMPNSTCLYFQGTNQQAGGAGVTFGDGLRCAGGTIIRLGTKTNVGGASQYPVGGDVPISIRGANAASDVRTYQAWYRNAADFCTPSTFNLSNGVSLTWQP